MWSCVWWSCQLVLLNDLTRASDTAKEFGVTAARGVSQEPPAMPRIPDADIAHLKQSVSLLDLAAQAGVEVTGSGHNRLGRCPFHEDRTPSLVIDPVKNVWHCLGACQAGGSNVDWVMRAQGLGFRAACAFLQTLAGGGTAAAAAVDAAAATVSSRRSGACVQTNPFTADAQDAVLLGQAAEAYHQALVDASSAIGQAAMRYLAARKIADHAAIRQFRVGYADRSLGLRLPEKNRRAGAAIRLRLTQVGILRDSGHEHLAGAVTFPLIDADGAVVGMYGRMIGERLRVGTTKHRYLPGPHRAAWNAAGAVAADGAVIVCESIIDALTFWCHGQRHVTPAYGVSGFTEHHRRLCGESAVKSVFLAYDADDAGDHAAARLADELMALGKSVYRVRVAASAKDINGLACVSDDPAAALALVLHDAERLGGPARITVPALAEADSFLVASASQTPAPSLALPSSPPIMDSVSLPVRPALIAAAAPLPPPVRLALAADGDDHRVAFGPRRYRVRALLKCADLSALKIGLRLTVGEVFHHDTIDLCQAKQRAAFITAAAETTKADVVAIKTDLAALIDACEVTWLAARQAALVPERAPMSEADERAALEFLRDPCLLARIAQDYEACGLVGDTAPKLVSYLCAISRKLTQPLAVVTVAPSAAGKSSLQDATLAFVPEEDRLVLSSLTGQALHYIDRDLRHRVLAIAEEGGASRAAYSLKLLQSDGHLSLAVPIKDADSGQISTVIKTVQGPVALFLTTTAATLDEELSNRCIVLTVDEGAAHTQRVHAAQRERETLDGVVRAAATAAIRRRHQNAQRLVQTITVVNPFARALTFRTDRARTRRDHAKYLSFIRAITLLHQHQRPQRTATIDGHAITYIETELSDIAAANDLAAAVLGRSLDELAPQTRTLLMHLDTWITEQACVQALPRDQIAFTRRQVREATRWSADQIDIHLRRLEQLEYVISHRGRQGLSYDYRLAYDGQGQHGEPFVLGLASIAAITAQMQQGQTDQDHTHKNQTPDATALPTSEAPTPNFRPTSEAVPRPFRGPSEAPHNEVNDGESPSFGDGCEKTAPQALWGGLTFASSNHQILVEDAAENITALNGAR